jgi:protoheme IX farnesyltransferase
LFKQYYELAKPERTFANIITASAGFLLASRWHIHVWLFIATLVGTSLVIASACALNNYIDRGIDVKMARTKNRALVKGTISPKHAIIYVAILGLAGFLILALYVNLLVVVLGLVAYFDYVVLYGIAKRRSIYGTITGSVSGAMSIVAGYCAVSGHIDSAAIILFLILTFWQMPHFFAIAIYRRDDYKAAGIPVWPVKKGVRSTKVQILLYTVVFVIATTLLTIYGYTGYVYLAVMLLLGAYWLQRAIQGFKASDNVRWARGMFGVSLIVLLAFCAILSVGALLP